MADRRRILCRVDGEEQVIFGTLRYESSRYSDDSVAVIVEEGTGEEDAIRISEWDVLEFTDAPLTSE